MRRFVSLTIALTIFAAIVCGCNANTNANKNSVKASKVDYSAYKTVIKEQIENSKNCPKETDYTINELYYGFLNDFDKNGINELVLFYLNNSSKGKDKGSSAAYCGYLSIYTIQNQSVKPIVKDKIISTFFGKEYGCVGLAEKNGKDYLLVENKTGQYDVSEVLRTVDFNFYEVYNNGLKKVKSASSIEVDTATPKRTYVEILGKNKFHTNDEYKIDNKKASRKQFFKMFDEYDYSQLKVERKLIYSGFDNKTTNTKDTYYFESKSTSINKLLNKLK